MSDKPQVTSTDSAIDAIEAAVAQNRGWFIALGVVLIVVGVVSMGAPFATTIVAKVFLGWLFLVAGISQATHAFFAQGWRGFVGDLLIGLLYTVVGVWLTFFPLAGIIGLTVLLAATFVIEGFLKFQIGLKIRPTNGWLWIIISGLIAIAAGILLVMGLPSTATWAIGLLVGVNILMSGVAFLLLAFGADKDV
jgi:uncharacterized membrane protein HdeD (DUF308 family)